MKKYTLVVKSNLFGTLYFDKKAKLTLDKSKQVAFEEDTKNVITADNIRTFIVNDSKYQGSIFHNKHHEIEKLEVEIEFITKELEAYTKEITYCGRKIYAIPNPKQDLIDELETEIKSLESSIDEVQDEIRELEDKKERYEDDITSLKKRIDELEK